MESSARKTTRLLNLYGSGDRTVEEELLASVYEELHALAVVHMRDLSPQHLLQPTALIHEAWMRLAQQEHLEFDARGQFYRLASKIMRSVLVDHARRELSAKRGGQARQLTLEGAEEVPAESDTGNRIDLLALDEVLQRLDAIEPELCRLVEMRFFGGLTHPQIAEATDTPLRTVERSWRLARAWLHSELSP